MRRYAARAGVALLCILVLVAAARIADRLERGVRADCSFYLQIANLPSLTPRPNQVVVDLATAARSSYIEKGCEGTKNPQAGGSPFPEPPPTFTAVPSPPQPRR
jgi:hypothetical protein